MSAILTHQDVDVTAAQKAVVLNVSGELFVCEEASAKFQVQLGHGEKFDCKGGFSVRSPEPFQRITIFNLSTADTLTVSIYVGNGDVEYHYTRIPGTYIGDDVSGQFTLSVDAQDTWSGINAGHRRKSFRIENLDAALTIWLQTSINAVDRVARVLPGQIVELETDADLIVRNPSLGSTVNVIVCQIFYK